MAKYKSKALANLIIKLQNANEVFQAIPALIAQYAKHVEDNQKAITIFQTMIDSGIYNDALLINTLSTIHTCKYKLVK